MNDQINHHRRRFLVLRQSPLRPLKLAMVGSAKAQSAETAPAGSPAIKPGTNTSFGSAEAGRPGVLDVGYAEAGPPMVRPSFFCTAGLRHSQLCRRRAAAGIEGLPRDRAVSARLRHDAFLSGDTVRNGQQSVIAVDIIALMDSLKIEKASRLRSDSRSPRQGLQRSGQRRSNDTGGARAPIIAARVASRS